jgi:hypothetical protein
MVEMMGGTIWVESELGSGSTFCFRICLPLTTKPPLDFEAPVDIPKQVSSQLRVLLVEDKLANQKLAMLFGSCLSRVEPNRNEFRLRRKWSRSDGMADALDSKGT